MIEQLQLLVGRLFLALGRLLDAQPHVLLESPQIGDDALSRAAIGPKRLDQRPVCVSLAVLFSVTRSNEHARILRGNPSPSSRKVYTTSRFTCQRSAIRPFAKNPGKLHTSRTPISVQKKSEKSPTRRNCRTWVSVGAPPFSSCTLARRPAAKIDPQFSSRSASGTYPPERLRRDSNTHPGDPPLDCNNRGPQECQNVDGPNCSRPNCSQLFPIVPIVDCSPIVRQLFGSLAGSQSIAGRSRPLPPLLTSTLPLTGRRRLNIIRPLTSTAVNARFKEETVFP